MKQFTIDGQIVYALNMNNALRKAGKPYKKKRKALAYKYPWNN